MTRPKPEQREATIVVRYWWCGSQDCTRMHKTAEIAAKCPKPDQRPRPNNAERDSLLWQRLVVEGVKTKDAAKERGVSSGRALQIIATMARKRGYSTRSVKELRTAKASPDGMDFDIMRRLGNYREGGFLAYCRKQWVPGGFMSGVARGMDHLAFIGVAANERVPE
jgi:hypothetical protein